MKARRPEAVTALRARLPGEDRWDVRHAIILALATSRDDAAFGALLELVARGSLADAKAEALRLFPHDEALQRRRHAALEARRSPWRVRLLNCIAHLGDVDAVPLRDSTSV